MLRNCLTQIGEARIARVYDSSLLGETAQTLFPDFDRRLVKSHERWLCPNHFDRESGHIVLAVQSFVIEVHGKIVLIDTCIGNDKDRPDFPEMHRLSTLYLDRLANLGLAPADVDYVMCTHLHSDHVGWNTQMIDGRWVPTFPNAEYIISRLEYENQKHDAETTSFATARYTFDDSVRPIVSAGKARFVEADDEVLGFSFRPSPGHTPGHILIELTSQGEKAIFAGDAIHSPIQIPFWSWSSKYCMDPKIANDTRRALLEYCASKDVLLIPGHFAAPHVARIKWHGDSFLPDFC